MVKKQRKNRRSKGRRVNMRKMFSGGLTRGSVQPRTVSASPWCRVALTSFVAPSKDKDEAQYFCVKLSVVRAQLKKELGLNDLKINVRVAHVSVWTSPASSNSDENFIVMAPSDLSASIPSCASLRQLNWYETWGTAVRPAHIHYAWPRNQSMRVFTDTEDGEILLMDLKGTSKDSARKFIFRFQVQWRCDSPDPRPTLVSELKLRSFHDCVPPDDDLDLCEDIQQMVC